MKVVDMHCDTAMEIYHAKLNQTSYDLRNNIGHIDLMKMISGDYLVQNFALFTHLGRVKHPFEFCKGMLLSLKDELHKNSDLIAQATSYDEILKNELNGKMSCVITIEEGGVIEGDFNKLKYFYDEGVRMMTLTWNYINEIGHPNCLTPDGRRVQ